MRPVHVEGVYAYVGELPPGCRYCVRGVKLVVFVTGLCDDRCFYCPVSRIKLGRDVVFADEEPARSLSDILEEAFRIGAEGASITGGDPLIALRRSVAVVRLLKLHGGPGFHVHLYTTGRYATSEALRALEDAGLDEIRFHVRGPEGLRAVEKAVRVRRDMRVGVEVPVAPDSVEELKRLLVELDRIGVDFVNLNELEVSPDNYESIVMRGYRVRGFVVEGSYEAALELVAWASSRLRRLSVHFCPARFKDRVQTRARLLRKAVRTRMCFEAVRPDGSVATVVVRGGAGLLDECCGLDLGSAVAVSPLCPEARGRAVELQPTASRLSDLARAAAVG